MAAARCMLWDRGYWESDDPERGFKKGDLKFTLHGDKLHGSWVLVRMKRRPQRRQAHQLAADQAPRRIRQGRRGQRHPRRGSIGRLGPIDGADRRRQGQGAKAVHAGEGRQRKADAVWQFEPRRCRRGARQRQDGGTAIRARDEDACTGAGRQGRRRSPRCRISSRRSFAPRSSARPTATAGATRSSSTAIACSCGSRTARPR